MLTRCDSRHRHYTELCNRSSTSSLGSTHVGSPSSSNCNMLEDYWEDASVSLRSYHSLEASPTPWLGSPAHEKLDLGDGCKSLSGSDSHPLWPRSYSFDANEYMASHKGSRRSFPPPLASCSTLSIKGGGRFVLKEMDADRPHGFFRAERGNGRLRLELILPDEVNDEEDNQEEGSSPVEDMGECVEWGRGERSSHVQDGIKADKDGMDVIHPQFDMPVAAQQLGLRNLEVEGGIFSDDSGYLADNFLTFGRLELDHFVADHSKSHVEQEPLWNVDARKQALASLSPWSPNQMCVHESIARIRPALGLAMS